MNRGAEHGGGIENSNGEAMCASGAERDPLRDRIFGKEPERKRFRFRLPCHASGSETSSPDAERNQQNLSGPPGTAGCTACRPHRAGSICGGRPQAAEYVVECDGESEQWCEATGKSAPYRQSRASEDSAAENEVNFSVLHQPAGR